jgi:hypothetical protein
MLSQFSQLLTATPLLSIFALSPKRAIVYAAAAFLAFSFVWYLLWLLPIHAWFRKPIQLSGECPNCGSKDVRPSHVNSVIDRNRKRLGLLPFRCRGCTRRFISRSTGVEQPVVRTHQVEAS